MSTTTVYQRSFFADLNGLPLDSGSVYIGTANQDPETNPISTYWDSGLTVPAVQPLTVTAGYVVNNGIRAAVYVGQSSYSLRVRNRAGVQVDYVGAAYEYQALLAASSGSSLVGYQRPNLTGAAARTVQSKASDIFDLRDMDGLDLTGANSMTTLLQAAVDHAIANKVPLHVPIGMIALDGPINISDSLSILGESCGTGKAIAGYNGVDVTAATRFHLAHSGKGFALDGGGDVFDWVLFRDIMTSREQPTPTLVVGSFTPGSFDYDFDVYNAAGLQLQNVCMLNPTKGVNMRGGASIGRLWTDNLMGQPLTVGVNIDLAADVCRMHNTHFWPFWQDQIEVARWTLNNCDHLWLKRCDTPMLSNYFSIAARSGIRFGNNGSGGTTKLKASNVDIDFSGKAIWFDSTASNCWGSMTNVSLQGAVATGGANIPELATRENIRMEGASGCFLSINNLEVAGASGSAIILSTSAQRCKVSGDLWLQNYGTASGNTDPGISVASGSEFINKASITNSIPGLGALTGGAGRFDGIKQAYVPSVTPQSGSYTSVTPTANFIREGGNITGSGAVTFTTIGTGTGYVRVSLPYGVADTFVGSAINVTTGTNLFAVGITGGTGYLQIQNPGGGNVGVNGQTIAFSFQYNQAY